MACQACGAARYAWELPHVSQHCERCLQVADERFGRLLRLGGQALTFGRKRLMFLAERG